MATTSSISVKDGKTIVRIYSDGFYQFYEYVGVNTPMYRGMYVYRTSVYMPTMLMFYNLDTNTLEDVSTIQASVRKIVNMSDDITNFFLATDLELVHYHDKTFNVIMTGYVQDLFIVDDQELIVIVNDEDRNIILKRIAISDYTVTNEINIVKASRVSSYAITTLNADTRVLVYENQKHMHEVYVASLVDGSILATFKDFSDFFRLQILQCFSSPGDFIVYTGEEIFRCSLDDEKTLYIQKEHLDMSFMGCNDIVAFDNGLKLIRTGPADIHVQENYNSFVDTKPARYI